MQMESQAISTVLWQYAAGVREQRHIKMGRGRVERSGVETRRAEVATDVGGNEMALRRPFQGGNTGVFKSEVQGQSFY